MTDLLFMDPIYKEKIWGGESWVISGYEDGESLVASGIFQGKSLGWLWREHPEIFGNEEKIWGDRCPLLIKIIHAKEDLSIQVHPDDAYAWDNEGGSLGKTECWYVLDCGPDTTIVIGHHAKDKEELSNMIGNGEWNRLIRELPVKKGDFFQINPGCIHAVKGGTTILETQQSSDITYRVYDYGRLSDGKPRELHVKQSLDVIKAPFVEEENQRRLTEGKEADEEQLIVCDYYSVYKYRIHGSWDHWFGETYTNLSVIEGEGTINNCPVREGTHIIIPAGLPACCFEGNFTVICSKPVKKKG